MKVIFLDLDGVLTTEGTHFLVGDPQCVSALNRITNETDAKIVISSTWRLKGLKACVDNLKLWGVQGEIIDVTPSLMDENATRGAEIKTWLSENHSVSRFVILDDDTDMDELRDHLIRCDTNVGLTDANADFAIQRLL